MLAKVVSVFALASALVLVGCGGKEEVKKNEGVIVNTMPGAAGAPGGGAPAGGASGGVSTPANSTATAPPVPAPGGK